MLGISVAPTSDGTRSTLRFTCRKNPVESQVVFATKKGKNPTYEPIATNSILELMQNGITSTEVHDPYFNATVKRRFEDRGWVEGTVISKRYDAVKKEMVWKVQYDHATEEVSEYALTDTPHITTHPT